MKIKMNHRLYTAITLFLLVIYLIIYFNIAEIGEEVVYYRETMMDNQTIELFNKLHIEPSHQNIKTFKEYMNTYNIEIIRLDYQGIEDRYMMIIE